MGDATTRVVAQSGKTLFFRRRYSLEVISGPERGRSLITARETATVGSARFNDLVLDSAAVSRHHLRIKITDDGYLLIDLDSTNGTFCGELQLHRGLLHGPADLRLGDILLRFKPLLEEEEVKLAESDHYGALLGRSPAMRELYGVLDQLGRNDSTVLVLGETGSGKELVAREIHRHGRRADQPFVVVDCAAIPSSLMESELFGHTAGAFTGATVSRPGPFEEAERGTVFLDEIGDLDLELQPRLLRVLERREVKRVGESHYRPADVRVIAATHRDLAREVNRGSFRADLFYRLAVVQIEVPPLRRRPEDLDLLLEHFWSEITGDSGPPAIAPDTLRQLRSHPWPGNVRELRNATERLAVFSNTALQGVPSQEVLLDAPVVEDQAPSPELLTSLPFKEARAYFERRYLAELLARCDHNVSRAAAEGAIDRVHLYRLVKKHGLQRR